MGLVVFHHRGGTLLAVSMAALNFVNSTEAAIALGRRNDGRWSLVGNTAGGTNCGYF